MSDSITPTKSLHLDTVITPKYGTALSTGLAVNTPLVTLDLSGCASLGEEPILASTDGLSKNEAIRTLPLSACGLEDAQVALFVERGLPITHRSSSCGWTGITVGARDW
jgi:hypothetical protein